MKPKTITIIGLGLMGGSLAAACRRVFPKAKVFGVSRSQSALRKAKNKKWIHQGFTSISSKLSAADLVVICTPVQTISSQLKKLDSVLSKGTLVTDVGSVKESIEKEVKKLKLRNIQFVGAHPMVGSHRRGIQAASPRLYDAGYTLIIKSSSKAFKQVKAFWKKISPKTIELSSKEHDRIVSSISHLPHGVATCLMLSLDSRELSFAAKGLLDTTRVAAGDPSIWLPIFKANKRAISQSLQGFERQLGHLKKALQKGDYKTLEKLLKQAQKKRLQISI